MKYLFSVCIALSLVSLHGRSIHRIYRDPMPYITIKWQNDPTTYRLSNYHLEYWSLFTRYSPRLLQHKLPTRPITYRYEPNKQIAGSRLSADIDAFVAELCRTRTQRRNFTKFKIVKDRDFNYVQCSGLLIAKHHTAPFLIKLFRETPQSFVRPFSKGTEPVFFFHMGGGMNRYLAGFTRIPNREAIKKIITNDPLWRNRVTLPRKWFWTPENGRWLEIYGYNMGNTTPHYICMPGTYALVCDAIDGDEVFTISRKKYRTLALGITKYLGNHLDPHIDNFMIEKSTGKIAIIDTEHFASMIGLKEPLAFEHYTSWYGQLAKKCLKDTLLQSKKERREIHSRSMPDILRIK